MEVYAPLNSEPTPRLQKIEVATFFQLPNFQIIGLPCPEVAEARERVRSAIEASGFEFPRKKVVLNLSPASIKKRGTGLDLAMALAVLGGSLSHSILNEDRFVAWGELGLSGEVKPVRQMTRSLYAAWQGQIPYFFLALEDYALALEALDFIQKSEECEGAAPTLLPVRTLGEAWSDLRNGRVVRGESLLKKTPEVFTREEPSFVGSEPLMALPLALERVVGISAAGRHHLLLLGPRGAGKSHALEWWVRVQPPLSPVHHLRQQMIFEMSEGGLPRGSESVRRVGSQVKPGALTGGVVAGSIRPGEFALAHGGLLLADELPEWSRDSRESLREPLERGRVSLTRAQGSFDWPAQFLLGANGNFCPCGGLPPELPQPPDHAETDKPFLRCRCSYSVRKAYLARLSGPILDRVDIVKMMRSSSWHFIQNTVVDHFSREVQLQEKVQQVQQDLIRRWGKVPGLFSGAELEQLLQENSLLQTALKDLESSFSQISLRSRHKVLRLALSLAAWDEKVQPLAGHFIEASFFRPERYSLLA